MKIKTILANLIWFAYVWVRARSWKRATRDVEHVQEKLLHKIIGVNATTEFGTEHAFSVIDTVEEFRRAVPVCAYGDMKPYVSMIENGGASVLTTSRVRHFGVTSGSTDTEKLIPYNDELISEFQEGIDPWIFRLMSRNISVLKGSAYWSVTPVGDRKRVSSGGIPIGFDDERAYFTPLTRWVLDNVMVAPSVLAAIRDIDAFRYATLRFLVADSALAWLSVWNPTFLKLLLAPLEQKLPLLIRDVREGTLSVSLGVTPEIDAEIRNSLRSSPRRARELERICTYTRRGRSGGRTIYEAIWPKLSLISCWAHGSAKEQVESLREFFPRAIIEPKGLIATEAFVSFPYNSIGSALAITSHFFEFEDVEDGRVFLAHQLALGHEYVVIVTTGGGLYRYRLGDVILVTGFVGQCPVVIFRRREKKVVDLFGEKLSEEFVSEMLANEFASREIHSTFAMLAPATEGTDTSYVLYVAFANDDRPDAEELRALVHSLESRLSAAYHYGYARRLGQLSPLRLFVVDHGTDPTGDYLRACAARGKRLGDIKSTVLHSATDWSLLFHGTYVS